MTEQQASPVAEQAPPPTFDVLPLSADVRKAVDACGYTHPTPVQRAVFESASRGRSLVVQARTGTGKTAAFGLPILDTLVKKSIPKVQALVLTPTRELALQVGNELERLAPGADGDVMMLADADGSFTRALGLEIDLPAIGLSGRSERYSMVVEDGVVTKLEVEKSVLDHDGSSAACMLRG